MNWFSIFYCRSIFYLYFFLLLCIRGFYVYVVSFHSHQNFICVGIHSNSLSKVRQRLLVTKQPPANSFARPTYLRTLKINCEIKYGGFPSFAIIINSPAKFAGANEEIREAFSAPQHIRRCCEESHSFLSLSYLTVKTGPGVALAECWQWNCDAQAFFAPAGHGQQSYVIARNDDCCRCCCLLALMTSPHKSNTYFNATRAKCVIELKLGAERQREGWQRRHTLPPRNRTHITHSRKRIIIFDGRQ